MIDNSCTVKGYYKTMIQTNFISGDGGTCLDTRGNTSNLFQAAITDMSGSTEPAVTTAYMTWLDTSSTPAVLRRRNSTNTAWEVSSAPVSNGTVINSYLPAPFTTAVTVTTYSALPSIGDKNTIYTVTTPDSVNTADKYVWTGSYYISINETNQAKLNSAISSATSAATAAAVSSASSAASAAAIIPAAVGGRIIGVRTGANAFSYYAPNGTLITTSAVSTDGTMGINTCLDIAAGEGWEFELYGGGVQGYTYGSSYDRATITCTTSIVVRPAQLRHIWFGAVTLQMSITDSSPGISMNSGMMLNFTHLGQTVYTGTGYAVKVNPTSGTPLDGLINMIDSDLHFQSIISKGAGIIDISSAHRCKISLGEMNGNNGSYADNGVNLRSSIGNIIDIGAIHEASSVSLYLDSSSNYNTIRVGAIEPALKTGNNPVGMQCYGSYNNFDISVLNSITTLYRGFSLEEGASYNYVHARKIGTTSNAPYYDGGTENHGRVNGVEF